MKPSQVIIASYFHDGGNLALSLRKGLIIFILLAFGVGALIILRSVDHNTIRSLLHANKLKLLLALCVVFIAWICDAGRFCALSYAAHERVSFPLGIVLTWLNYFGSAVTPMQSTRRASRSAKE